MLDIALDQASLESVDFKPLIRIVFAQHTRNKFFCKEKIFWKIERLKVMSKKMGVSVSEILRRAIDEYWERFEKKGRK